MGATHSTTNSRLRASVLAGIVLGIGVVCAIALRERPVDDPPPAHGMATNEAKPDAPLEGVDKSGTPATLGVELARVHVTVGATEPSVAVDPSRVQHLVLRVVDGRGKPVAGAQVRAGSGSSYQWMLADVDGCVRHPMIGVGLTTVLSCEVSVPGLTVSREFKRQDLEVPIEVVLDPIGYYEFTVLGTPEDVRVDVFELPEGPRRTDREQVGVGADGVRIPVGLGSKFRLVATKGTDRRVVESSTGPTIEDQIVPVELDFRRCTARWRVPEQWSGPIELLCVTETVCTHCKVNLQSDSEASAEVPYRDRAWLVFVAGDEVWESESLRISGDLQFGLIALTPRPLLGVLEVRSSDGSTSRATQCVESVLFPSGARLPQGMLLSRLVSTRFNGTGTEFRGLRLLAAVEVRPTLPLCYAEPRVVALRGGTTERVQMRMGAQVDLVAAGSSGTPRMCWLESMASGVSFLSTTAVLDGGAVRAHRFQGLSPGDYRIVCDTFVFSPDRVHVPAGSQQRVVVTVQPR